MHDTARENCCRFFAAYDHPAGASVIEIGSQDVNGSLRELCPTNYRYTGVDFVPGLGVDVVLEDPYRLPFPDNSIDAALSSSCFEHSELFWLLFLEIMRVLKPAGAFYLDAPSNSDFHRYPVDCWRFYPDAAAALITWGRRNGFRCALLEQYTAKQGGHGWNDYVAVFLKDENAIAQHPRRILDTLQDFTNGSVYPDHAIQKPKRMAEDQRWSLRRPLIFAHRAMSAAYSRLKNAR